MPDVGFGNLLGVLAIALLAPLALGFVPRIRVPAVVLEIVLGIVIGIMAFLLAASNMPAEVPQLPAPTPAPAPAMPMCFHSLSPGSGA